KGVFGHCPPMEKPYPKKYGFLCSIELFILLYADQFHIKDQGGSPWDGSVIVVPISEVGRDEQPQFVPDLHGQQSLPETCGQGGVRTVIHGKGGVSSLFLSSGIHLVELLGDLFDIGIEQFSIGQPARIV